jgi:hypothetical protein
VFERLDDSTERVDVRGVMAAASAYAVLGGVARVHHEALGAYPVVLALMVYALAAGRFARRGDWGWMWVTARDSVLAVAAGSAWICAEAWAAESLRAPVPRPRIDWSAGTIDVTLPPPTGGMNFSIAEGDCFGPDPVEAAAFNIAAVLAVGMGAIMIGWVARWLARLQQETVDG